MNHIFKLISADCRFISYIFKGANICGKMNQHETTPITFISPFQFLEAFKIIINHWGTICAEVELLEREFWVTIGHFSISSS